MYKSVVVDHGPHLGATSGARAIPWEDTIIYEAHVKGLTQQRERHSAGACAAPIAGLAEPGDDRASAQARRHRDRAAADPRLSRRPLSARPRPAAITGATTRSASSRPSRATPPATPSTISAPTVAALHDAGIEVILDVVYNHTAEGNHLGPTLCYRGIDNASYYWLHARQAALLRELHRHRQCAQARASARAADGDGFAALLGRGVPRRRLPLRSRHARSAAAPAFDPQRAVLRRRAAGPGARQRQDDRRAVGHRPRRLSGRRLSDRLVGMERHLSPDRCGASGAATAICIGDLAHAHDRLGGAVPARRPQPARQHQSRHRA